MHHPGRSKEGEGPGVPEAVPRTAQELVARLGLVMVDRLWIFPPLVRGRRESGLLAASRRIENSPDPRRRLLVTAPYVAERTGKGLSIDWTLVEQGEAPADRFPRMMEGVARRAGDDFGDAREVELAGDEVRWHAFLDEFDADLLLPVAATEDATPAAASPGRAASHPEDETP
jgi:hypothetical protein